MKRRVGSLNQFVHDSNVSVGRLADDLEEMHRRVDWFDTPQAIQNLVEDLQRQVAQLQACCCAAPPAVSQRPAVVQSPSDAQPLSGSASATLRSPEQDQEMA
ncbi:hypothetical protein PPTG_19748 [Phytophthora nicotianae INRA-310]|uniref:Uncharacterized protein n=1 Tax=Phytophthora nicotianae (strain INRA-310) TaxID=761204 RepID=W2PD14_PHYN3|nr:hypothetical protein PPTG_19748 [Phytophthora nicotianae INRA-310]ETM98108.1 hypothetical protein PPTG_19748 [Phytophthora nicotianae INRA-310]